MKKGRTVLQAKRYGIHSCSRNTSLVSAARRMVEDQVSTLVVENDDGYLVGIITRQEVLRAYLTLERWAAQSVEEHMIRDVLTVSPQMLLGEAAERMLARGVGQIVVVLEEEGKQRPVALITDSDLVYHMIRRS